MPSNEQTPSLADAKDLHKTSVSDEVVIRFDHVTKTYHLYKNDRGRFLGIFNYKKKGSYLGSINAPFPSVTGVLGENLLAVRKNQDAVTFPRGH